MRASIGKKHQNTSAMQVRSEPLTVETVVHQPQRKAFRGGLYAVRPMKKRVLDVQAEPDPPVALQSMSVYPRPVATRPVPARYTSPELTTDEFIQVRLATVRESTRHCFWPTNVVASFLAAEVIT